MNIKVGDKVKVRNDLVIDERYGGLLWLDEMDKEMLGEYVTVIHTDPLGISAVPSWKENVCQENSWELSYEMLDAPTLVKGINTPYYLNYTRNGYEMKFPVRNVAQALSLADSISKSDILNDSINISSIDLIDADTDESWESSGGLTFDEFLKDVL